MKANNRAQTPGPDFQSKTERPEDRKKGNKDCFDETFCYTIPVEIQIIIIIKVVKICNKEVFVNKSVDPMACVSKSVQDSSGDIQFDNLARQLKRK